MSSELINADFAQRVVIATDTMPWVPSPQAGVERRMLDRIGGEVARATSLVRYAPASSFPAHEHARGEEFLVLGGVFSDEYGDYGEGTYVRNPPRSRHTPRTAPGCTILVKLRQMSPTEAQRVVIDTKNTTWRARDPGGLEQLPLHAASDTGECVVIERLAAGGQPAEMDCPGGEEIFILSGDLRDEHGSYRAGTWIRNPAGFRRGLGSNNGATYWAKRGHLRPMP
ncbi:cupin domain-containing protein [Bradyrhizobium sp. AZCC 2289]|uniref:cupin domain-containing protein n=1 Tax=Bradyrhizobium sp. AZCC 2289 TaxID=3117026 RepID=UPI002FF1B48B